MAWNKNSGKGRTTPNMEGNAAYKALSKRSRTGNLSRIPDPTKLEQEYLGKKK